MTNPAPVQVGQRYLGWGKTWEVTRVWPSERVAEARNITDPTNTIRWPLKKFRELTPSQ